MRVLLRKSRNGSRVPLSPRTSGHEFGLGPAGSRGPVHDGDAEMDFCDLASWIS